MSKVDAVNEVKQCSWGVNEKVGKSRDILFKHK